MNTDWNHVSYAQRIHFGDGAVEQVPEILREIGVRRVLLITTQGRLASETGERLVSRLGRSLSTTYDGVRRHVPTDTVQAALGLARDRDVDGIVSFGGGSCADLGKAVSFFVEQEAGTPGASYVDRPVLPHLAIPLTYSGAEMTPFFGMTDESTRRKSGGGGPTTAPLAVVYDPVLTTDTPPRVSAETGVNCLAHGIEAAYSPSRTPEAEAIALACIERVAAALVMVVEAPDELPARRIMLEAASLGGRSLQNSAMGAQHGLAQLLGGRTGMAHGLANAVLLAAVVRYNHDAVPRAMSNIARALGAEDGDAAGAVDRLCERLGLPRTLSEVGADEGDLDAVARMAEGNAAVRANPRPMDESEARALLAAIG